MANGKDGMIIGNNFLYVELQKSGCTHVRRVLQDVVGATSDGEKHNGLAKKPADKYVLGSVRNPWAWYVSLWAFGCKTDQGAIEYRLTTPRPMGKRDLFPHRFRRKILGESKAEAEAWRELYQDVNDREAFRTWLRRIHDPRFAPDLLEWYDLHATHRFLGFLSYRYCKLHVGGFDTWKGRFTLRSYDALRRFVDQNHLVDFMMFNEHLTENLIMALDAIDYGLTDTQRSQIRDAGQTNTSDHGDWRWYYDDECRDLVAQRDRLIIDRYGYAFDGEDCN
jgi:hypothetical protein